MFIRQRAIQAYYFGSEADQVMACGDEANDLSMILMGWTGGCHGQCDSSSEGSCNTYFTVTKMPSHGQLKIMSKESE